MSDPVIYWLVVFYTTCVLFNLYEIVMKTINDEQAIFHKSYEMMGYLGVFIAIIILLGMIVTGPILIVLRHFIK